MRKQLHPKFQEDKWESINTGLAQVYVMTIDDEIMRQMPDAKKSFLDSNLFEWIFRKMFDIVRIVFY